MLQIRENIDDIISDIETPESISISKTESKSSADATYIDVYNEATDESKTIRVANHYKEGVSGKSDYNIYISDYNTIEELNKAIEDTISKAPKATENSQTLQSKKITPSNDVDIMVESDYNKYDVTRKKGYKEGEIHASFNFSNAEKEQIRSEVWNYRKKEADGLHFIDLSKDGFVSYIYKKQGDNITPVVRFHGHEEILNFVRRRVENGNYKEYGTARRWSSVIRDEYRNNNSSTSDLRYRREKNKIDAMDGRPNRGQSKDNRRNIDRKSEKKLKNSEQSSFSLPKTDNKGRTLSKEQQEYFKESFIISKILMFDITSKSNYTMHRSREK